MGNYFAGTYAGASPITSSVGRFGRKASVGKKSLEVQDPCPANEGARTGSNSSGFIDSRSLSVWTIGKRSGACGTKERQERAVEGEFEGIIKKGFSGCYSGAMWAASGRPEIGG